MYLENLEQIIQDYDLWLLDQFGVLHNGIKPYPQVIETLRLLAQHQKKVLVLTNSGKRAQLNAQRLSELGIQEHLFDQVVSSGEVFYQAALNPDSNLRADFLKGCTSCFLLSHQNDTSILNGLPIRTVRQVKKADFILLAGFDVPEVSFKTYQNFLSKLAKHRLPMVCTNPDQRVLTCAGVLPGPGALALYYQSLGAPVYFIGKPHPEIYAFCRGLYPEIVKSRVIAVGDSLEHDILGAAQQEFKTWWLLGGVERPRFQALSHPERKVQAQELLKKEGYAPDFISFGFGDF